MTPLAAAVPYSAEAAGPLITSMLSMSSPFRSSIREIVWPARLIDKAVLRLLTRTPSTISSGSFERLMLFEPRMRIREPSPLDPVELRTLTPGVRAASTVDRLVTDAGLSWELSMDPMEIPLSRRRSVSPVAVTMIWSRVSATGTSVKSAVVDCAAATAIVRDCAAYPSRTTRSVTLPTETFGKRKRPSSLVRVTLAVPATMIWTSARG